MISFLNTLLPLAQGLEDMNNPKYVQKSSKEASLRSFLNNKWITGFHDVEAIGDIVISEQVANGQTYRNRTATTIGRQAIIELAAENSAIVKEYSVLLDTPFNAFCENQRRWAETDAVRDREYEGDVSVKKLASKYRADIVEFNKLSVAKYSLALRRMIWITHLANDPWNPLRHWVFPTLTDTLYRRIVFAPNYHFDDHAAASYELTLGKERDKMQLEEKLRKEKEREMTEALLRVGDAIVPYNESAMEDVDEEDLGKVDDEDLGKSDNEGFVGWEAKDGLDDNADEDGQKSGGMDDESGTLESKSEIGSDWDQLETADFDENNASDPFAWAKKFMWAEGEYFVHNFESVVIVTLQSTIEGTLLLTTQNMYFHQTGDSVDVFTKESIRKVDNERQDQKWKLNRLTDIHGRRFMLKAQAVEFFFADMKGLFLTFGGGTKERDVFFSKLTASCKVSPLLAIINECTHTTCIFSCSVSHLSTVSFCHRHHYYARSRV